MDDARKIISAHLFSFQQQQQPRQEDDEKEGPRQWSHERRLSVSSMSIMPFQETVLSVPLNHEDGGVRVLFFSIFV